MRNFKKVKMLLTIQVPVWTEVLSEKEELPVIKETVVNALCENYAMQRIEEALTYYQSIETGKAVGEGEDACSIEQVDMMVDWQKSKIKLEKVNGKAKKSKKHIKRHRGGAYRGDDLTIERAAGILPRGA